MANGPSEKLVPEIPQALIDRADIWAQETVIDDSQEQIRPQLAHLFVILGNMALQQRAPLVQRVKAAGDPKHIYESSATLADGTHIDVNDLLSFTLYRHVLPVPERLPVGTSRNYSLRLGIGADIGCTLGKHVAGSQIRYLGWDWTKYTRETEAREVFARASDPHLIPDEVRLLETVETKLPSQEKSGSLHTHSVSEEYGIRVRGWTPNLRFFGIDQDLPPEYDIFFHHLSAKNKSGGIDEWGTLKGDKVQVAKAIIRLTELTEFLEQLQTSSGEPTEEAVTGPVAPLAVSG